MHAVKIKNKKAGAAYRKTTRIDFLPALKNSDIEELLLIAQEEEPDGPPPHAWCLDWTLRASDYLRSRGFGLRETIYRGQYNLRARGGPHLWIETEDGTLIDGTVSQYCRDDLWVLPSGHPLRTLYLYAGPDGSPVSSAIRGSHPLI